jgi:hypothetical protein
MTRAILTAARNDTSHALLHGSDATVFAKPSATSGFVLGSGPSPVRAVIIALLLTIASTTFAVELPESCRVRNRSGNCVFSNCATLGYRHNIKALQGLAPNRKVIDAPGPVDDEVRARLHRLGVHWRGHDHGDYSRDLLPLANTHGVIVSMRRGTPWMWGKSLGCNHSIILTRYDAQGVAFYCPDNPQGIWRASREWLDYGWLGNSMVFDGGE